MKVQVDDVFSHVEKVSEEKETPPKLSRASWRGVLSIDVPSLGLGAVQYHLKAAKAHGDLEPVKFVKVDSSTGREVIPRQVPKLYRYKLGPRGERLDFSEIPYDEGKEKVRYDGEFLVSARTEKRYFDRDELEKSGKLVEIPFDRTVDKQIGPGGSEEEIEPFDRTTRIEVDQDSHVPLSRIAEYKLKEVYQLNPDTDKRVREDSSRVRQLARYLLDKQTALVSFFSWGRGYQYYTAVIYPYERNDGKLWLLMGMSEGVLKLDPSWALEEKLEMAEAAPLPVARSKRPKPKVSISR